MKSNNVLLTALFVILSVGCSKDDDSPILLIGDIESENVLFEKPSIEETVKLPEFNKI